MKPFSFVHAADLHLDSPFTGITAQSNQIGNILFTASATIHLVDINNISKISTSDNIPIDDKGYPACDKSIEALSLIEKGVLGHPVDMQEDLYDSDATSGGGLFWLGIDWFLARSAMTAPCSISGL